MEPRCGSRPGSEERVIRHRPSWLVTGTAVCLSLLAETACGQSGTIWSFLGVGSAQNSSDPAIAAAAKAKAAKHKICKKKKALKYLAGMGCSPERPEVAEAILAAMSDPDEPVRYEAVMAVLQSSSECMSDEQKKAMRKAIGLHAACEMAKQKCDKALHDCLDRLCGKAGPKEREPRERRFGRKECEDPCKSEPENCQQRGGCCTPGIRGKLAQLAYGRDERGCFLERSERVLTAAEQALKACNACGGCGCECGAGAGSGRGWREMPPEERREEVIPLPLPDELPPLDLDGMRSPMPPCRNCEPTEPLPMTLPPCQSVLLGSEAAPPTHATSAPSPAEYPSQADAMEIIPLPPPE